VGETKTPALINAAAVGIASVSGAALFTFLDGRWQVPGLAIGHTIGFIAGTAILSRAVSARLGRIGSTRLVATVLRSLSMSIVAGTVMAVVYNSFFVNTSAEWLGVVVAASTGGAVYVAAMAAMKTPEMARLKALVVGR
jgi:peptidoglycan biosynthesis protein MviN/MurJ (putative lipid II flippase)